MDTTATPTTSEAGAALLATGRIDRNWSYRANVLFRDGVKFVVDGFIALDMERKPMVYRPRVRRVP